MVYQNLRHAHLQELGLVQIPVDHLRVKGYKQLGQPLGESKWPSQLHGHGPCLVCEVDAFEFLHPNVVAWDMIDIKYCN